ncbi:hypothetical protein EON65_41110 [archaeon]|nr:MAG: hypothetical protein EON65_41110 [archaeon]
MYFTCPSPPYVSYVPPYQPPSTLDHSIWAQWTGPAWNMDLSIFTPYTQTDEFGEVLGTSRNPSCAVQSDVCAFGNPKANGFGPQVPCCSGLSCNCDAAYSTGQCVCK